VGIAVCVTRVYVAVATGLCRKFGAVAMALMVVVVVTLIAVPVYFVEAVEGVLPSVV
jgi:hypothetical protein